MKSGRYYAVFAYRHVFLARLEDGHPAGPYVLLDVRTERILCAGLSRQEVAGLIVAWTGNVDQAAAVDIGGAERWAAMGAKLSRHPSADANGL